MKTKTTYVFEYKKGDKKYSGISCGFLPEFSSNILEERLVLYPSENMLLKNIHTGEEISSVWLKDGDTEDNYTEVMIEGNEVM